MPDSTFWHDLAGEFEKLPHTLFAKWHYISGRPGRYEYKIGGASRYVEVKFEQLARKAGAAVDQRGEKDSLDVWLDELRTHDKDPRNLSEVSGPEPLKDGTNVRHQIGTIRNPVEASATRCLEFEILQTEAERQSKAQHSRPEQSIPRVVSTVKSGPTKPAIDDGGKEGGSAANWEAIEILFLSDHRVQIHNGTNRETLNYGELGFADRRVKQGEPKPTKAWETLRLLAKSGGVILQGIDGSKVVKQRQGSHAALRRFEVPGRTWPKLEKRVQEIRKTLGKHFLITADPIPFVGGIGYQARFKIGCSPSFRT